MERRTLLSATAVGLAAPAVANAQPRLNWRCAGSFPKSLDTLHGNQEFICRRVSELTDGQFQIRSFAAGEIVPALQVLDAAGSGTVEVGYTAPYYYVGKDPSMTFGTALPFGLNSRQMWSWLYHAGGRAMLEPVWREQGVHGITAGNTGAQMGGWFRREIKTVQDLQGLKFRIGGIGGQIFNKVGAVAQQLGGADIYYYPGWWEPGPTTEMMVNLRHWEALPPLYKAALEAACAEGYCHLAARYDALNPPALRRL